MTGNGEVGDFHNVFLIQLVIQRGKNIQLTPIAQTLTRAEAKGKLRVIPMVWRISLQVHLTPLRPVPL